jgi:hypothetical protein
MDPACAGLLLDVLEAAIDHRVERIKLALDPLGAVAAAAALPSVAAVATPRRAIPARSVASAPLAPRSALALGIACLAARVARTASRPGPANAVGTAFALGSRRIGRAGGCTRTRATDAAPRRAARRIGRSVALGGPRRRAAGLAGGGRIARCRGGAELRRSPPPSAAPKRLTVRTEPRCCRCGGCSPACRSVRPRRRTRRRRPAMARRAVAQSQCVRTGNARRSGIRSGGCGGAIGRLPASPVGRVRPGGGFRHPGDRRLRRARRWAAAPPPTPARRLPGRRRRG